MSDRSAFTFVPIARSGYRPTEVFERDIETVDAPGRTQVDLELIGSGEAGETTRTISVDLSVHGPGSVTGVDIDQVVRMEPEPDTGEFPPNQFPLIEFDNPELPWRYSPQRSDEQGRNRPWLCLVVARESRVDYEPVGTGPLPVLHTPTTELPKPAESWAWAHAQHVGDTTPEDAFATDSIHTRSRLLCPRNLSPETKYRACVVPTFEPGRQAGLGLNPETNADEIGFAWADEDLVRLPVYHSWTFRTDEVGDFEYLARLLKPVEFGPGIGFKTVDVSNPGPEPLKLAYDPSSDSGIVGLGGALRSISAEPITYDVAVAETLRELLNKPHELEELTKSDGDGDAVGFGAVGPHLYGQWHAGNSVLEPREHGTEEDYPGWLTALNTDPRHRIAAGYGVQVIQREQERLMESAWEQFGDLRAANRKLHRLQCDELVLTDAFERFQTLSTGTKLAVTSPWHASMPDDTNTATLHARTRDSDQPIELASPAFRRITRPTGPLGRRSGTSVSTTSFASVMEDGRVPRLTDGLDFTMEVDYADLDENETEEIPVEAGRVAIDPDRRRSADAEPLADTSVPSAISGESAEMPLEARRDREIAVEKTPAADDRSQELSRDEELPRAVADTLAMLESVEDHCDAARVAMESLSQAIQSEDVNAIDVAIAQPPTVRDRVVRIREHTFEPLAHALGKLLVDPRPDRLAPEFDEGVADERIGELRLYHRRCSRDVADALETLEDEPTNPWRARCFLARAISAVTCMRGITTRIVSNLETAEESAEEPAEATRLEEADRPAVPEELESVRDPGLGAEPIGESATHTVTRPDTDLLESSLVNGFEPTARLHRHAQTALGISGLDEREYPVEDVMAAPTYTEPAYRLLTELDEERLLPGKQRIPRNAVGTLVTNTEFIEAFMAGLNHEMARELQWHRFPTDRRGTYFRRFWNRKGHPNRDTADHERLADIDPMHTWTGNSLGEHSAGQHDAMIVLLIRGELLRRYPQTDVFAAKAVDDEGDRSPALPQTHVVPEDAESDAIAYPEFRGTLGDDISFFGFPLTVEEALYAPYDRSEADGHPDEGWFFVLQEPPGEPRFGLDVGTTDDLGDVPPGITDGDGRLHQLDRGDDARTADHGWNAVSWAHLVDDGDPNDADFLDVATARPGRESWRVEAGTSFARDGDHEYTREDAATWGYNSAHMAITSWIRPVRVSIHAADMIPDPHWADSESQSSGRASGRGAAATRSRGAAAEATLIDYPRPVVDRGVDE